MTASYDSSYRKMVLLEELAAGTPRVFQSGGAVVVLLRKGSSVEAIDGSCMEQDQQMSREQRLRSITACVAERLPPQSRAWPDLVKAAGLATRIEDGWVWVCVDGCKPEGGA